MMSPSKEECCGDDKQVLRQSELNALIKVLCSHNETSESCVPSVTASSSGDEESGEGADDEDDYSIEGCMKKMIDSLEESRAASPVKMEYKVLIDGRESVVMVPHSHVINLTLNETDSDSDSDDSSLSFDSQQDQLVTFDGGNFFSERQSIPRHRQHRSEAALTLPSELFLQPPPPPPPPPSSSCSRSSPGSSESIVYASPTLIDGDEADHSEKQSSARTGFFRKRIALFRSRSNRELTNKKKSLLNQHADDDANGPHAWKEALVDFKEDLTVETQPEEDDLESCINEFASDIDILFSNNDAASSLGSSQRHIQQTTSKLTQNNLKHVLNSVATSLTPNSPNTITSTNKHRRFPTHSSTSSSSSFSSDFVNWPNDDYFTVSSRSLLTYNQEPTNQNLQLDQHGFILDQPSSKLIINTDANNTDADNTDADNDNNSVILIPQHNNNNNKTRIDTIEVNTKQRIQMLRGKVKQQKSNRLLSKLDFVEMETMRQIEKLREDETQDRMACF